MSETTTASSPEEKQTTFSVDYVRELRSENKSYRLKATELETALQQAQTASQKVAEDFEAQKAQINQAAQTAVTRAELKAVATKHGMVDLDGLKLLDLTKVKINDVGELEGADALFKQAKESKPWLFGVTNSTTTPQSPPQPAEVKTKTAKEFSDDEMRAFEREHGIRVTL